MSKVSTAQAELELGEAVDFAHGRGRDGFYFVPDLDGWNGLRNLQRMAETDETIGAILWVFVSTLAQIEWKHVPCVNDREVGPDHPDYERATKWADFADSCLDDMEHSWGEHVEEALTMIWAGFAPCEIVFRKRDGETCKYADGRWGYEGLYLRDQHTVADWMSGPDGKLTHMVQQTLYRGRAEIPVWKLLHYRTSSVLNNPWGRSLLRNAYRVWTLKQRIQESEAVGIDREMCGMPVFDVPEELLLEAEKVGADGRPTPAAVRARARIEAAKAAAQKMRFNQAAGLVLPSDVFEDADGKPSDVRKYDFRIISSSGQRSIDARTAARDYDRATARTVLMQFLHLGDRAGGSNALSSDQSTLALRSLKWFGRKIADEYNRKALRLLWLMNASPAKYRPRLEMGRIADETIDQIGLLVQRLADAEPLFAEDPALKEAVLDKAGLRQARRAVADQKPKPKPVEPQPGTPPAAKPPRAKPMRVRSE
jgi:hypothetical protein